MASILAGTATSITALSQASTLVGSLSNLLLASPQTTKGYQPQNPPTSTGQVSTFTPPPSLLFHYEGEQSIKLSSDITDHFIEDNTALQDQIALRPIKISTKGFIGELNNVPPPSLALLQQATNTLTTIGSYVPGLSVSAQLAYDNAFAAYQLAQSVSNAAVAAISSIGGGSGESVIGSNNGTITRAVNQNKQQVLFQQLYGYWQSRTLFTIQTPWAIFQNMALEEVTPVQSAEDRMSTEFSISFKMINTATTALLNSGGLQGQGRNATQSASLQSNGTGPGTSSISLMTLLGGFGF